jgi:SAM-dependent methyltransferase
MCHQTDTGTLHAYDHEAAEFAEDWHTQPIPSDMYALVREFFTPGPTADIGCGSGRDTSWLTEHGFPTIGYDPSAGLLGQARGRYPKLDFRRSALPELDEVPDHAFANVLCETVIMHLPSDALVPSLRRLLALLRPAGTLYLSWRVTEGTSRRDEHGRLYAAFDTGIVVSALSGASLLRDEELVSVSSGKKVHRIIARQD